MKTFFFRRDPNYDKEYGNKDWLYINNLGYYSNISQDISTSRPHPRADYHLLYVSTGQMRICGSTLNSGDAYLFLPNELHTYTYKKAENSHYYWFHFTGNKVKETLSRCGISRGVNKDNERKNQKDTILSMLVSELCKCSNEASDFAVSLFFSFLTLFKINQPEKCFYTAAIEALESTSKNVSISSIAKSYNVTTAHFIRLFKKIYGTTPNEYRQNYRISQAVNLLKMTNLSVQDISHQCGFEDSLYFSRIFKNRVGVSPSKYRK
jgi:AraC-like DNA-binding protein